MKIEDAIVWNGDDASVFGVVVAKIETLEDGKILGLRMAGAGFVHVASLGNKDWLVGLANEQLAYRAVMKLKELAVQ